MGVIFLNRINSYKELYLIENNIFSLYDDLIKCELYNKRDDYFKVISYLKMTREIEDKLYDKDNLYFYSFNNFLNEDMDIRDRIFNRINDEKGKRTLYINYIFDNSNVSFWEDLFKYDNTLNKDYFYLIQDRKLLLFIKKLQVEIDNCNDMNIKLLLIKQKFRLIKLNSRLEKELLMVDMDINKLIEREDEFLICCFDYNRWYDYENTSDIMYSVYFFKLLIYRLFMLCNENDYKIRKCYLASCLETMSYNMLECIKDELDDILSGINSIIVRDDIISMVYDASDKSFSIYSKINKKKIR